QIDQDADRPVVLGFDLADGRHQFAHALVIGVAHIDAEDVGAGLEQPADDGAIPRRRTERRNDLGAPLPSHGVLLPAGDFAAGVTALVAPAGAVAPAGGAVPTGLP